MEKRQDDNNADAGKLEKTAQEIEFALNPAPNGDRPESDDPPGRGLRMGGVRRGSVDQRIHMGSRSSTIKPLHINQINTYTQLLTNSPSTVLRRLPLLLPLKQPLPYRNPDGLRFHRRPHLRLRHALQPPLDNPDPRHRSALGHERRLRAHVRGLRRGFLRNLPWHLYLSQGVAVGTGLGAIFIPSVQVVPQWFLHRRSLAGVSRAPAAGLAGWLSRWRRML